MDEYPKGLLNKRREKFKEAAHKASQSRNRWVLLRNCIVYLLIVLCIILAILWATKPNIFMF